jgi:O-acetyl-ADP-ribose deacetylase (regulator of RNase III)
LKIKYIVGDATQPLGKGNKVIVHVCNDIGAWGAGFVKALSRKWPEPEQQYKEWFSKKDNPDAYFGLGSVQVVCVEDKIWIANMIGQKGIRGRSSGPPVRYDAIAVGLEKIKRFAQSINASVHMPKIGSGLAGGNWDRIEDIIKKELDGVDVIVYELN